MHRIDGPGAAPGGHFTDGDPNVGTPATVVTQAWAEAIQEELAAVVEATGVALAKPNNHQLLDAIKTLVSAALPPGAIQAFAVTAVPVGWLACDGSTFASAAYPALATALGTIWGAAPAGQTRLPDLRGEFVRGWDSGRGVDAGRTFGTAQADDLKTHSHAGKLGVAYGGDHIGSLGFEDGRGTPDWTAGDVGTTGGAETRPRNVALLYCIKV
jgi:phage-related tail fiber protein